MPETHTNSLIAALLLGCVGVFAIMAGPILTEALVSDLGFTAAQAGQVSAVEALGTALGPVLAALWMGRVNWRVAAVVAILVVVGGNALSAFQTQFTPLLVLRLVVGLAGEGTAFALAMAIIGGSAEKDRNFAFLIAAQVALGVLAFLLLPMPRDAGVKGVLLPLATLALVALLTVRWIPQPTAGAAAHGGAAPASGSAANAWIALLAMLIWCTGLGAVWFFVKLIGQSGGLDATTTGQALAISTGVAVVGALAAAALADRFGRVVPVALALLVQVAMIWLLQGQFSFLQFAVTAAVFQTFWNLTGPYIMGTIASADTTGKISLLIPTAQIGGFFLGPIIAGGLMDGTSYAPANQVGIAGCLVALVVFMFVASRLRPAAA